MSHRQIILAVGLLLGACESKKQVEDLVKAKMDAEKVVTLSNEVDQLNARVQKLEGENATLKSELELAKGRLQIAQRTPTKSRPANAKKETAPEVESIRKQATGGNSFK